MVGCAVARLVTPFLSSKTLSGGGRMRQVAFAVRDIAAAPLCLLIFFLLLTWYSSIAEVLCLNADLRHSTRHVNNLPGVLCVVLPLTPYFSIILLCAWRLPWLLSWRVLPPCGLAATAYTTADPRHV